MFRVSGATAGDKQSSVLFGFCQSVAKQRSSRRTPEDVEGGSSTAGFGEQSWWRGGVTGGCAASLVERALRYRRHSRYALPLGYQRQQAVKRPKLGPWVGVIDAIL